jgi:hypothetical protein
VSGLPLTRYESTEPNILANNLIRPPRLPAARAKWRVFGPISALFRVSGARIRAHNAGYRSDAILRSATR